MLYVDDIATGSTGKAKLLRIAGRPDTGSREDLILLEQPERSVQMHWMREQRKLLPHYTKKGRPCPNCTDEADDPKEMWYLGGLSIASVPFRLVIVELTPSCYSSAQAGARSFVDKSREFNLLNNPTEPSGFYGLWVRVTKGGGLKSQRFLRCEGRWDEKRLKGLKWPFSTLHELARIWEVPVKPKLYRAEEA